MVFHMQAQTQLSVNMCISQGPSSPPATGGAGELSTSQTPKMGPPISFLIFSRTTALPTTVCGWRPPFKGLEWFLKTVRYSNVSVISRAKNLHLQTIPIHDSLVSTHFDASQERFFNMTIIGVIKEMNWIVKITWRYLDAQISLEHIFQVLRLQS